MDKAENFYHSLLRLGVQPGLERIEALLRELGNPQQGLKTVHVAGTNGKGTTSTLIAEVLHEAGYKTGLYTSPYIIDFRERIKFNSRMITEEELSEVTAEVSSALKRVNEAGLFPTEFEAITAAAFLFYKRMGCEIAVLECGLGGRFDATNVLDETLCSVIVSVSFDHMALLGDTLPKIAWEKAGIIKNRCPVVTSKNQPDEVLTVLNTEAQTKRSPLFIIDEKELFSVLSQSITGTKVRYRNDEIKIPFCGAHQMENTALALTVIERLREQGYIIPDAAIKIGIKKAFLPARTEIISEEPLIILDGSHNEGSTHALSEVLGSFLAGKKLLAVMGMMADKDIVSALENLACRFSEVITVTPSNPRSLPAQELAEIFKKLGVNAHPAASPREGIEQALASLSEYDALIVCGSLYLAADIRGYLTDRN